MQTDIMTSPEMDNMHYQIEPAVPGHF